MKNLSYRPAFIESVQKTKNLIRRYYGSFFDDESEFTWFCSFSICLEILEELKCFDHNLSLEYFIQNMDNYFFWQGMKTEVVNIIKAAELLSDLEKLDENIHFEFVSLDEKGIIFYFKNDFSHLIKDHLTYMIHSTFGNPSTGEKDGLFACNMAFVNAVIESNKERLIDKSITVDKKTYIMIDNRNGYHKIGYSKNPTVRESTLQSEAPDVQLLFYCDVYIESELHQEYDIKRVRGEWFNLTDDDVIDIYNRMSKETGFTEVKSIKKRK